jgi:putative transposase
MKFNETTGYLERMITEIRIDHPTMCFRAMYYKIKPMGIGRDKFEQLCKKLGFKRERKINYARTTNSNGVIRFENLMTGLVLTRVNQAFCSDITYFEVNNRFYYITLIMDCYSRRILGYSASDRLTTVATTLPALKMVMKNIGQKIPEGIIFHSDGGGQYYDKEFLNITTKHKFKNSMCEFAYENGKAERLNGIIKNNYLRHWIIRSFKELIIQVGRAVLLYNTAKPHKALKYKTPVDFEKEIIPLPLPKKPKMTESFDAKKVQILGVSSPQKSEPKKPQIQDVVLANG